MQNAKNTTATTTAPELSPRAQALQSHDNAGFTGRTYSGLSKPRNSGIAKAPDTTTSKAAPRLQLVGQFDFCNRLQANAVFRHDGITD